MDKIIFICMFIVSCQYDKLEYNYKYDVETEPEPETVEPETEKVERDTETTEEICYLSDMFSKKAKNGRFFCSHEIFEDGLVQLNIDNDCNNILDYCFYYKYENNNLVQIKRSPFCQQDISDLCYYYEYDLNGNTSLVEVSESCIKGDMDNKKTFYSYTYNFQGQIIAEEIQFEDSCQYNQYDLNGRVIERITDNCNGKLSLCVYDFYETYNNILKQKTIYDFNCNGFPEQTTCYKVTHNDRGHIIKTQVLEDCAFINTHDVCYTWNYYKGYLTQNTSNLNCDDSIEEVIKYKWECHNI